MKTQNPTKRAAAPKTKTQQLEKLRARADAVWEKMRATPEGVLDCHGPLKKEWLKRQHAADALEKSFIVYQGQEIDATRVNYQSGDISLNERYSLECDEHLYRTSSGMYYLRREQGRHLANPRVQVHRLSAQGAILWAVTRANPDTNHLRRDAVKLLASPLTVQPGAEEGPDDVTVALTLPRELYRQILAMGAYDDRVDFSETVVSSMEGDVQAWLEAEERHRSPSKFLSKFLQELDSKQEQKGGAK